EEEQKDTAYFQEEIIKAIEQLQLSVDNALKDIAHPQPAQTQVEVVPAQEEVQVIEENEFMEEIDDLEAEEDPVQESEKVPQEDCNDDVRHQMEHELQQARQALSNFVQIIAELREQKTCQPRGFERGAIHREIDRMMRCAFLKRLEIITLTHVLKSAHRKKGAESSSVKEKVRCAWSIALEAGTAPSTLQGAIIVGVIFRSADFGEISLDDVLPSFPWGSSRTLSGCLEI
ncbi:unnamed protein product, partial [Heligmosomoides polygyrus]|uniref:BAG domain-containing protein n=1 Tax=Heligmosomoides polygyrus TaxID=6339 RepID=A0A183FPE4_HELPZ